LGSCETPNGRNGVRGVGAFEHHSRAKHVAVVINTITTDTTTPSTNTTTAAATTALTTTAAATLTTTAAPLSGAHVIPSSMDS